MRCFLISTLAEYQTRFWVDVGDMLRKKGYGCEFISFDDRSTEMLTKHGFQVYSLNDLGNTEEEETEILKKYGITTPERWFLHERFAYGEQSHKKLMEKLCSSTLLAERAITNCKETYKDVLIIQEVGGFLSVVGCYFAAKHNNVTNWFIEPAFFKGKMFFTKDSFLAPKIKEQGTQETLELVQGYINNALKKQQIVIPEKDKHHYSSAIKKIVNKHNITRLLQKSFDKYLLGKKQEFGYIGKQLGSHLKMLLNSYLLKNSYTPLTELGNFIYFPLHVPADMALTLRSPEYVDQLSLVEQLIRSSPFGHNIAVKEHPAMIGALDAQRIKELIHKYPQFKIISPVTNNYDVIRSSDLIVSINSKSGAEAMLLSKNVIVLGDAFYSNCDMVTRIDSIHYLEEKINHLLEGSSTIDPQNIIEYFHRVWDSCVDGELYISDKAQTEKFTDSMINAVA